MSFNFVYSLRYIGCQTALILGSVLLTEVNEFKYL